MRILAYGGIGYYERLRLGEWGEIARGALEDTLGMPGEQMIYGVGFDTVVAAAATAIRQPYAVLRQRQTIEGGRSYAFSLLIDPGTRVWERFEWNAAEFIHVLLAAPEKEQLFAAPESFGTQTLEEFFNRLEPLEKLPAVEDTSFGEYVDNFTALWIGTAFADSTVNLPPTFYEIENRPSPLEIAAFQATLPVCFRNAGGWMVGANVTNARNLGARLTLDDGSDELSGETEATMREYISFGNQVRFAWETILDRSDEFSGFTELMQKPVWEWNTLKSGANDNQAVLPSPQVMAERMIFLSRVLTASNAEATEFIHQLDRQSTGVESAADSGGGGGEEAATEFLQPEIRQAIRNLLLSDDRTDNLNRFETEYLLGHESFHLNESALRRLDKETVFKFFKGKNLAPDDAKAPLRLSPELRYDIWQDRLHSAAAADLPREFQRAMRDLTENVGAAASGEALEMRRQNLRREVEKRLRQPGYDLFYWREFYAAADEQTKAALERAALANIRRKKDWEKEYLAFADDAGGGKLFSRNQFTLDDFSQLIDRLLAFAATPDLREESLAWLNAVGRVPQRRKHLSISQKRKICRLTRELPENAWRNFYLLDALFRHAETFVEIAPAPPEELPILKEELRALKEGNSGDEKQLPNLDGLCDLLGDSAAKELSAIFNLPIITERRCGGAEDWIKGWRRIDKKRAQDQTTVLLTETEARLGAPEWIFDAMSSTAIEKLFVKLLFEDSSQRDERYRRRVTELLTGAAPPKYLKIAVQNVFQDYFYRGKETFARRFGFDEKALSLIFSLLPKRKTDNSPSRKDIFTGLAVWCKEKFPDEACRVFDLVTGNGELIGENVSDYRQTVLAAIQRDENQVKAVVKRQAFDRAAAKNIDRILAEASQLKTTTDFETEADDDEDRPGDEEEDASNAEKEAAAPLDRKASAEGEKNGEQNESGSKISGVWQWIKGHVRSLVQSDTEDADDSRTKAEATETTAEAETETTEDKSHSAAEEPDTTTAASVREEKPAE